MSLIEWPRRVAALGQFHVDDPQRPVLSSSDEHHVRHVLRARSGEEIVVTDGAASWAIAQISDQGVSRVTTVHVDPTSPTTTLYLAPLKGDRSEWAVTKATELGVTRIVPLISQNLVVKFKSDARAKIVLRWRRIAAEACGQSRRTLDVVVDEPVHVREVPDSVAIADFDGGGDWSGVRAVAIGPEGGWSPDEWTGAHRRLTLGPTVLRAETAGVVAGALLAFGAGNWAFSLHGERNE